MSRPWQLLVSLVREAKSANDFKEDLLKYVTRRYGEHEADELLASLQRMPYREFIRHATTKFVDPRVDSIIRDMTAAAVAQSRGGQQPQAPQAPKPQATRPTPGASSDKGSGASEPIPQRPDRAGTRANVPDGPRPTLSPGERPTQAVGTAGQNQPKPQPSVDAGMGAKGLKPGQSGVELNQKKVDYVTKTYGAAKGDALAARLGVPTTAERTRDGKVRIWSADKVARMTDPDVSGRTDVIRRRAQARPGGPHKPDFRGSFVGQVWQPHGVSQKVATAHPDQATGNFKHGSRYTDPSREGQPVVWDGEDWVLPSVYASKTGQKRAAGG